MRLIAIAVPLLAVAGATGVNMMNQQCPYWILLPHDSKPNTPYYRGGCLEPIRYFEGKMENGKPASRRVRARHGPGSLQTVEVDLREVDTVMTPTGPLPIFEARYGTKNLCEDQVYDPELVDATGAHPELTGKAIAIPGYWDGMTWRQSSERGEVFTVACLSGAIAKCAYWGYIPWGKYEKDGEAHPLEPVHRACVDAIRARYDTEDTTSYTCSNTEIDLYDSLGILKPVHAQGFQFESLWGANGLVCMNHSRLEEDGPTLSALGLPPQADCRDPAEHGWSKGALVAVASRATLHRTRQSNGDCSP